MPKANRSISTKLLAMRFMQREGEQKVTQDIEEREKAQQSEAHWRLPKSRRPKHAPKVRVEYISDYLSLMQTAGNGRRKFQLAKSTKSPSKPATSVAASPSSTTKTPTTTDDS